MYVVATLEHVGHLTALLLATSLMTEIKYQGDDGVHQQEFEIVDLWRSEEKIGLADTIVAERDVTGADGGTPMMPKVGHEWVMKV